MKAIIAHYKEDLNWIEKLKCESIVYTKDNINHKHSSFLLKNIGREADTYLNYIVNNYNMLDDITIFLQGNPFDHCYDIIEKINNINHNNDVIWLCSTWGPITKDYQGGPGSMPLPLLELCDKIFNKKFDQSKTFTFAAGAQYAVPKKFIINKSLDWWKFCYSIFNEYIETSPWAYERLWPMIWQYENI